MCRIPSQPYTAPRQKESPKPCEIIAGGSDIVEPRKVIDVRPLYPPDLLADGVTGTVLLKGIVTIAGTITDIKVLQEGHEKLAAAASAAVAQWQFTPTKLNCLPIEVELNVTVNFVTGK